MDGGSGMAVYFVKGKSTNHVKVGFTKGDPQKRLSNLQTSASEELEIIHVIPEGTTELEARLHEKFRHNHLRGEWFKYRPDVAIYLGDLDRLDKTHLFLLRLTSKWYNDAAIKGHFGDWIRAKAELSYFRGPEEQEEFFSEASHLVDISVPPDDWEKDFLMAKKRRT